MIRRSIFVGSLPLAVLAQTEFSQFLAHFQARDSQPARSFGLVTVGQPDGLGEQFRLAAQALAAEERKVAGGTSTIFFVLQLQNDLLSARAAELRAKADHLQAVAQLRFADGSLLEHRNVSIRVE